MLVDITEVLGSGEDRYFSNGFKTIDISYDDIVCGDGVINTRINVKYTEGWSRKQGQNMAPHLGTTEFISIAAVVTQKLMERVLGLNRKEIETSWISRFILKVKTCTEGDCSRIPVSGHILSTESRNGGYESRIVVSIGSVSATLHVCHQCHACDEHKDETTKIDLYKTAYKLRSHSIKDVIVDEADMTTIGNASLSEADVSKKGLGAAYSGMIFTDFILVIGQMTQALLYSLNKASRDSSSNLWLREIDVWCTAPSNETKCRSEVKFLDINTIHKKEETWQSVILSGKLGSMNSKIKVAHRIN